MGFRDWHGWLKSGMIGALLGFVVVMSLLAFFGHFSSSPANPLRVYDIFIDILFFTIFSFLVGLLYNWVINFRKSNWLKGGIFFGILSLLSSLILFSITISIEIFPKIQYIFNHPNIFNALKASIATMYSLSPGIFLGGFAFMGYTEITLGDIIPVFFFGAIASFILYFIIGSIIGFIVGLFKSKKQIQQSI